MRSTLNGLVGRTQVKLRARLRIGSMIYLPAVLLFWTGSIAGVRAESLPDFAAPVAVSVSMESGPKDGRDTYRIGETISVRVSFTETGDGG